VPNAFTSFVWAIVAPSAVVTVASMVKFLKIQFGFHGHFGIWRERMSANTYWIVIQMAWFQMACFYKSLYSPWKLYFRQQLMYCLAPLALYKASAKENGAEAGWREPSRLTPLRESGVGSMTSPGQLSIRPNKNCCWTVTEHWELVGLLNNSKVLHKEAPVKTGAWTNIFLKRLLLFKEQRK
jgi:hypothetical protein